MCRIKQKIRSSWCGSRNHESNFCYGYRTCIKNLNEMNMQSLYLIMVQSSGTTDHRNGKTNSFILTQCGSPICKLTSFTIIFQKSRKKEKIRKRQVSFDAERGGVVLKMAGVWFLQPQHMTFDRGALAISCACRYSAMEAGQGPPQNLDGPVIICFLQV